MTTSMKSSWIGFTLVVLLPVLATAGESITYYHNDVTGSPASTTDQAGYVRWRADYLPYGDRDQTVNEQIASSDNDRWFTGHVHDEETGLIYAGARYYSATLGRFLSVDPLGFREQNELSSGRYAYGWDNPFAYVDPDGRDAVHIVYSGYMVTVRKGFRLPLGHAGVLLIDDKTGYTRYFEYGRYDPNGLGIVGKKLPTFDGNVRTREVPNEDRPGWEGDRDIAQNHLQLLISSGPTRQTRES